jgi:hypothetical protein
MSRSSLIKSFCRVSSFIISFVLVSLLLALETPVSRENEGGQMNGRINAKLFPKSNCSFYSVWREMNNKNTDRSAVNERAELYFLAHPGSPSAVRRPRLFARSGIWIALLGRTVRDGIAGFGPTVEAALRAFDVQYINALRPPSNALSLDRAA